MLETEYNHRDSIDVVQRVVRFAVDNAYAVDAVQLDPCFRRRESRDFMFDNNIIDEDVKAMLADLRVSDYSHTSCKSGEYDAYVFGVNYVQVDCMIYLKFQIIDSIIVISLHEANRDLCFPYKEEDQA